VVSVPAKKTSGFAKVSEVCRSIDLNRASFYAPSKRSHESIELENRTLKLSEENPRYGYRRITELLKREGVKVNSKRIQSLRRKHGLQVRKKQRRMRRIAKNEVKRLRASSRNEVWSWDFVHDQTEYGSNFRMLSVLDEYTRQCHSLAPRKAYRAENVIEVLESLIEQHGAPQFIRSDNGPEFIAYKIRDWLKNNDIKTHYITPGSPWEQCYIESFHDKLRDEFTNREIFYSVKEAEILLEGWRKEYNDQRIHSSLGYQTPNEYATNAEIALRATPSTISLREERKLTPRITQS